MTVYHSGTDIEMINDWAATGLDWFISHVQNKKGEVNVRYDQFMPFRMSCAVNEISVTSAEIEEAVIKEIEAKVSKRTYTNTPSHWQKSHQSGRQAPINYNSTRSQNPCDTLDGRVTSDESKDPSKRGAKTMGTPTQPIVKHKTFVINGKDEHLVRQEIVHGRIIHEAVSKSPAARYRAAMTNAELAVYYREWELRMATLEADEEKKGANPPKQLVTGQSRSVERSEEKRTDSTTKPTGGGYTAPDPNSKRSRKKLKRKAERQTAKRILASEKREANQRSGQGRSKDRSTGKASGR
jgi:hypothetical protein